MEIEPTWNWTSWSSEHPVRMAFNETMHEVLNYKLAGIGLFPSAVRKPDLDFLIANQARLISAMDKDKVRARVEDVMGLGSRPTTPRLREDCLKIMGVAGTNAEWSGREYLIIQFLAVTAGLWANPSRAMLYSATQAATHATFRACRGQGEVETTSQLITQLRSVLGERFVATLRRERIYLPPHSFLDFGTASMQGWRDRLGSDFALVIGTIVDDLPVYRAAVFQAKWEEQDRRGWANVSQGGGSQLRELVGTGMGYYVFYPEAVDQKAFVATVRSAESVDSDVGLVLGKGKYNVDVCCARNGNDPAWDFAAFVSVAMTSPQSRVGKVFADADAVAKALSKGRKEPLVSHVVFADLTGCLTVRHLAEKLRDRGYDEDVRVYEALSSLDDRPEADEESSPDASIESLGP